MVGAWRSPSGIEAPTFVAARPLQVSWIGAYNSPSGTDVPTFVAARPLQVSWIGAYNSQPMIDVPTFAGARPQPGPLCWYFLIPFTACDTNFFLTQSVSMQIITTR
jgi:hypothetical protein